MTKSKNCYLKLLRQRHQIYEATEAEFFEVSGLKLF